MKRFFAENSYTMVKLFIFQLAISIMGFVTATATLKLGVWSLLSSVFCTVVYLCLIWTVGYMEGQKDGIRIEAGRLKPFPAKFFIISLISNSINIVAGLLAFIFRACSNAPLTYVVENAEYSPEWAVNGHEIANLIARLLQAMYLGIINYVGKNNVILLLIIPLPAIIVTGFSYIAGVKYKDGFIKQNKPSSGKM